MPSRAKDLFDQIAALSPADRTTFVEAWVTNRQAESEYLDFKQSASSFKDPKGGNPDDKDADSWCKMLASFANTEGGIVVWGIKAVPNKDPAAMRKGIAIDTAIDLKPIEDTARHVQLLKNKTRDSLNEPLAGIGHLEVAAKDRGGGYVISYVPDGPNKPYRAMRLPGQPHIQRIGDTTEIIPQGILRSLFYRRLTPRLQVFGSFIALDVDAALVAYMVNIYVENWGTGTARELAFVFDINREAEISHTNGFTGEPIPGSDCGTRYKMRTQMPLHPGDSFYLCYATIEKNEVFDVMDNASFHLSVYMTDEEPQHFQHMIQPDDYSYKLIDSRFEIKPTEHGVATFHLIA